MRGCLKAAVPISERAEPRKQAFESQPTPPEAFDRIAELELGTKEEKTDPNPRELGKEIRIGSASSGTKEVARS